MKSPWRRYWGLIGVAGLVLAATFLSSANAAQPDRLEDRLARVLREAGFTGRVQRSLEPRLGRRLDPKLVELGRTIFFDNIMGLHRDNSCAGCHSPASASGIPNRSRSVRTTTGSWGPTGRGRATSAARRSRSTRRSHTA